jgi:hypothetical protein
MSPLPSSGIPPKTEGSCSLHSTNTSGRYITGKRPANLTARSFLESEKAKRLFVFDVALFSLACLTSFLRIARIFFPAAIKLVSLTLMRIGLGVFVPLALLLCPGGLTFLSRGRACPNFAFQYVNAPGLAVVFSLFRLRKTAKEFDLAGLFFAPEQAAPIRIRAFPVSRNAP